MKPRKLTLMMILLLTGLAAGCATTPTEKAATGTTPATPEPSKAPATTPAMPMAFPDPPGEQKSLEVTTAKGVQIYTCGPKKDNATQFEWTLKAPEAELADSKGYKVGKHYGGPTWESNDGSKVVGDRDKVQSRPAPNTIAWLLLPAKSTSGKGVFGAVKSIQRLNTEGGKAPDTGCDKANVGKEVRVDYKATYYFYVAKP
jgi:hypothetical protein